MLTSSSSKTEVRQWAEERRFRHIDGEKDKDAEDRG